MLVACVLACVWVGCPQSRVKAPLPKPKRASHRPVVVARFPDLGSLRSNAKWSRLEAVMPHNDKEPAACGAKGPVTVAEFPEVAPRSKLYFFQYPGCCETRCQRDAKTREIVCGRTAKPIACRKDVLVEARDERYAALTGSSFQTFDATAGRPTTRIFRFDLDADGTPEIVRWEELVQHQHVEWLLQAFRGERDGVRRVADIRFYHAGPWKPDLNFAPPGPRGSREIEIAVQDVDAVTKKLIVRKHVYRFDKLLGRYTQAKTIVSAPPGVSHTGGHDTPAPPAPAPPAPTPP